MATIYITSNADSGPGSLRQALADAERGDVITPDPEIFPPGTRCEITLASSLTIAHPLTLSGGAARVALLGDDAARRITCQASTVFEDVDFERLRSAASGGALHFSSNSGAHVLRRCRVVGCDSNATIYCANGSSLAIVDSAIYGNKSTAGATLARQSSSVALALVNTTIAGNATTTGSQFPSGATQTNCKTTVDGMIAPPPDDFSSATWTSTAWQSWNLRPTGDGADASGAVATESVWDVEGNLRRAGGAVGAYEAIDADLYWVGKDASGGDVARASFASAEGWSRRRGAATCDDVLPGAARRLFVETNVEFEDAAASEFEDASILIGGFCRVGGNFGGRRVETSLGSGVALCGSARVVGERFSFEGWTLESGAEVVLEDCEVALERFELGVGRALTVVGGEFAVAELAVFGALTLTASLTVERLTTGDGARIALDCPDCVLTATSSATIGATRFESPFNGYLSIPRLEDASCGSFSGAVACERGAGIERFRALRSDGAARFLLTRADASKRVLLERRDEGAWRVVATDVDGATRDPVGRESVVYRAFDGERFFISTARAIPDFWTVRAYGCVADERAAATATAWGEAPQRAAICEEEE